MGAPRMPAQWFSLLVGAFLVALGVLALVTGSADFGTVGDGVGDEFVIWRVSGWETILYMASGALGLVAASRVDASRTYAVAAGVLYAAIAVWGFIDGNDVISLLAVDTTDNITHAVIGGFGLVLGLTPERAQRRAGAGEPSTT